MAAAPALKSVAIEKTLVALVLVGRFAPKAGNSPRAATPERAEGLPRQVSSSCIAMRNGQAATGIDVARRESGSIDGS